MFRGISFYAAGHKNFPHEKAFRCFNPRSPKPALATLLSFGRKKDVPAYFCELYKDRKHIWQIQFGFRDFNDRELLQMHTVVRQEIIKRCLQVKKMIDTNANENTIILLGPIIEDTVTLAGWKKYARIIRKYLPDYKSVLVRSTLLKKEGGNYQEEHGTSTFTNNNWNKPKNKRVANMDGYSIVINSKQDFPYEVSPIYVAKWLKEKSARVKLVWEADAQGLRGRRDHLPRIPFDNRKYILTKRSVKWYYNNVK